MSSFCASTKSALAHKLRVRPAATLLPQAARSDIGRRSNMRKGYAASAMVVLIALGSQPSEIERYYKDYGDTASDVESAPKK